MTLTTGTLVLKGLASNDSIALEVLGSSAGVISLVTLSNSASPTVGSLPTGMRDFAGHTQGGGIPSAPAKCNTANGAFFIEGSWFDTSTNEDGFDVEWSVNGGAFGNAHTVGAGVTTAIFPGTCFLGATYAIRVRAYNGSGDSAWCTDTTPVTGGFQCVA